MVKKVGKYELGRSLGEGTFGKVKYAIDTETNEAVAIKILDKEKIQKQNMGNQIKKEISIMKMVKHKNIVHMVEVLASKTKIFIVLELVTGGELFDKIVQVGKLSEEQARFYFRQLIEGVEYCHKLGICHRDLKPENLLLDEHGNLKISDFGLSSLYVGDADGEGATRTELLHTTCGTPNYVAPEVLSDQGYDGKKADVWSCGVILYVLLAGFLPFDESTIVALFAKIQSADFTYPSWFSAEVRSLIDQMLVADPHARITISNIKNHPWYTSGMDTDAGVPLTELNAPTADQLEKAVSPDTGDYDDDEHEQELTAPARLNAFDLVSQCGGLLIDKMFSPEIFYSAPASDSTSAPSASLAAQAKSYANLGGTILFGANNAKGVKSYHFSSNTPPTDLARAIYDALQSMGFTFETERSKSEQIGVIRANFLSAKGMVGMYVQVFVLTPTLSLLEIRKGKGDILEWITVYSELVERRIGHLINRPAQGDAKSTY
jgi:serine/threonine protein kinase